MKPLVNLYFLKKWAKLRDLFSKPISAVVTLLAVGVFSLGLLPIFLHGEREMMELDSFRLIQWVLLGMLLLFFASLFLSKHKSLFFLQDSYFLFTGPFSTRQVLTNLVFEFFSSALMLGGLSFFMCFTMGARFKMPNAMPLHLLLVALLVAFVLVAVMDALYLRELVQGKKGKAFLFVVGGLALLLVGVFGYSLVSAGMDFRAGWEAFSTGRLFYTVPVFGWAKLVLDGVWAGSVLEAAIGYGLLLACCLLPTLLVVNTKGYFYEQAMLDAENYTDYYQKAREGKADAGIGKVRTAKVRFKSGPMAIFSKNLLLAKKQNFFRVQDVAILAAYTAMAVLLDFGFLGLCFMILFWLFLAAGSSSLVEDLKHHYIYFIPGRPAAKLAAALAVPVLKTFALMLASVVVGGLLLREAPFLLLLVALLGASFCLLLTIANVITLRIMKSRNNLVAEQMIRMVFVLIASAPSLGLMLWLGTMLSLSVPVLFGIIIALNLLISGIGLAICAPMLKGNALTAD